MDAWAWWLVLVGAVWAAHWGSERLAEPLQKVRARFGLSTASGASLVALATASPEVSTNAASALQAVSDIGLGNLLGANIVSVPVIVTIAYLASRGRHDAHPRAVPVSKEAAPVQAYPYLFVVALVAVLTLPAPWRGLQPVDGWIMLIVYLAYLAHALLRSRSEGRPERWTRTEAARAVAGIAALVVGAYFTVRATEAIVVQLGIARVVGGLFITATMSVVPEAFATWSLARQGHITPATTSVIGDNLATMTLAFFPLALAGTAIADLRLYGVNLAFVALFAVFYAGLLRLGPGGSAFIRTHVLLLVGLYGVYLGVMAGWVL